MSGHFDLMLG